MRPMPTDRLSIRDRLTRSELARRNYRALLLFGPEGLGKGYLNNHMMLQPIITVAPGGRTGVRAKIKRRR